MSVLAIVRHAGLPRAAFYTHFSSVDEAFLVAYDEGTGQLLDAVEAASVAAPPDQRLRRGLDVLLAMVDARPDVAQLCFVEAPGGGPAVLGRRDAVLRRTAAWIVGEGAIAEQPKAIMSAAGLHELVAQRVRHGARRAMPTSAELAVLLTP